MEKVIKVEPTFFPVVGLKMTNKCNMRCQFCCEHKQKYPQFSWENYENIINMLSESGTKRICFTGGEPLCCPFIEKALKLSFDKGMENVIFTSDGELLNNISIPPEYITSLRISVHGIGKTHDDIVKKKGAFENIYRCISKLLKNNYNISITTVLTPLTYNLAEDMIKWCINNKIEKIYFANLLQSGLGKDYINQHGRITDENFAKLIKKLQLKYKDKIKIISHPYENNAECILIYGNGDMYIDPYFDSKTFQKNIGNIIKDGPKRVFNNFSKDKDIWNDYLKRLSRSTLFRNI